MREKEELTLNYMEDLRRQLGDGARCLCGEACCKDGKPTVSDAAKRAQQSKLTKAPASAVKAKPSVTKAKPSQPRVATEPLEDATIGSACMQGPLCNGQTTPLVEMEAPSHTRSGMHEFYSWQFGPPQEAI